MTSSKHFNSRKFLTVILALGIYGAGPVLTKVGPLGSAPAHADEGGAGAEGGGGGHDGQGGGEGGGDGAGGNNGEGGDDNGQNAAGGGNGDDAAVPVAGGATDQAGGGAVTKLMVAAKVAGQTCSHDCHD